MPVEPAIKTMRDRYLSCRTLLLSGIDLDRSGALGPKPSPTVSVPSSLPFREFLYFQFPLHGCKSFKFGSTKLDISFGFQSRLS